MDPIEVADAITECPCSVGDDLTGEIDGGEFADDLDAGALADDGRSDHDLGALTDDERAELERRDYAKVLATIGGLTAVGSLSAPLVGLTRVFEREYTGPIYSDGVALVDAEGNAVDTNFLAPGEHATVFPETHPGIENAPTLLVRFDPGEYGGETRTEWVAEGYAAYSKVCTHAGCMVSEVEGSTLVCPCHFGKFDPLGGGTVVGGPPPRPIPQLPLSVSDDGTLVATGDFESAVGPGGGE
jgi:rieske iron-sulfur protein